MTECGRCLVGSRTYLYELRKYGALTRVRYKTQVGCADHRTIFFSAKSSRPIESHIRGAEVAAMRELERDLYYR